MSKGITLFDSEIQLCGMLRVRGDEIAWRYMAGIIPKWITAAQGLSLEPQVRAGDPHSEFPFLATIP